MPCISLMRRSPASACSQPISTRVRARIRPFSLKICPQISAARGVAAVHGRERCQRGETHAGIREMLRFSMIPQAPAARRLRGFRSAFDGRQRIPRRTRQHGRGPRARPRRSGAPRPNARSIISRSAALPMPRGFIQALGLIKWAAAGANLELGDLDRVRAFRHPARGARSRGRPSRCAVSDRRLPDGLRHQQQHECERGHRAPRHVLCRRHDRAGPSERRRQSQAKQQRRHPHGDPPQRGDRAFRRRCCRP